MLNHLNVFFLKEVKTSTSNLEYCGNFCLNPLRLIFHGKKVCQIDEDFIIQNHPKKTSNFYKTIKIIFAIFFLVQGVLLGTFIKLISFTNKEVRRQHRLLCKSFNKNREKIKFLNQEKKSFELFFSGNIDQESKFFLYFRKKSFNFDSIFFDHCSPDAIKKFLLCPFNNDSLKGVYFHKCSLKQSFLDKLKFHYFKNLNISLSECNLKNSIKIWTPGQENLTLRDNDAVNDNQILSLAAKPFKINSLVLNNCSNISDFAIKHLIKKTAKSLKEVSIESCPQITLEGISSLIENSTLEALTLNLIKNEEEENHAFVDSFFHHLKKSSSIKKLSISNANFRLSPRHVSQLKNLKFLENLTLENVNTCSENFLIDILCEFRNLKVLDLKNNSSITSKSLEILLQFCKNLTYLNIKKCPLITQENVDSFKEACKSLPNDEPIKNIIIEY